MKKMNVIYPVLVLIFLSGCAFGHKVPAQKNSLISFPQARARIESYYENGDYERDLKYRVRDIINYCSSKPKVHRNTAVVMYVEDVLLETYSVRKSQGFAENDCSRKVLEKACMLSEFPLIKSSGILFEYLLSKGFKVFLVSRRSGEFKVPLMENLAGRGLVGWSEFYTTPETQKAPSIFLKKLLNGLRGSGFDIIATISAVPSGIDPELGGRQFVMPNYMYSDLRTGNN